MLHKALIFLARFAVGKKLVDLLAVPARLAAGHRSEILLGLQALIYLLKHLGLLDTPELQALAEQAQAVLLGALPITLADKARKVQDTADGLLKK